ncbi:MAG: hypothetical protein WAN43_04005 [Rhodomicrobium sp.]
MDKLRADRAEAQSSAGRGLRRAMAHSTMLRRAFHLSLSRRHDADDWKTLESAVAAVLEKNARHDDVEWFVEADKRLRLSVTSLLRSQAAKSSRVGHYLRAAGQVYKSTEAWRQELDELTVAYWRHSAVVWITLWHLADVPDVTAARAKKCLDLCFDGSSAPDEAYELPLRPKKAGWSLSGAASSLAGAFRGAG